MSELFNEIQEDIRQERFDQLWRRYGKIAVGISIAIVLGTAAAVIEQNHRESQEMAETAKFVDGVNHFDTGDYKTAIAIFSALAENPSSSYYGPAMLRLAEAHTASGDKAAAAKTYAQLSGHDAEFGALAALATPQGTAIPDRHSAFYFTQSEQKGWQLVRQGKNAEAAAIFLSLRDDLDAPFSQRQRMQEALEYIAPEKAAVHD